MPSLNHLHTYERSKTNREIYRCIDPLCTHWDYRDKILGKAIICAKCHVQCTAMQMQLKSGQNRNGAKHLTCLACSKSPKRHEAIAAQEVISDILNLKDLKEVS